MRKACLFSIVIILMILSGCTGLTELTTYWGNNAGSDDIQPTGYHSDTQTGWMSYNDSTHLYFAFSFFDPRVQTMVLRNGMTVFIDQTKKMKEDCFVRFPLIKREIMTSFKEGQLAQQRGRQNRNQRTSTQMLLEQAQSFELQWKNYDDSLQVNPSVEKTDFHTFIAVDTANVLNIIIGIPIDWINPGGLSSMEEVVIGLRFGQAASEGNGGGGERPQMAGNQQGVSSGMGAATGGGGGRGGGRGRGGGGGGGNMAGGASGGQMEAGAPMGGGGGMGTVTTEFWYKTTLIKK
ncbi:MAG: hypothetical protein V2A67_00250 [Bacteroidota bacterium]